jgi:hypothetical protein
MTYTSTARRRFSALAATALVASLMATGAAPAAATSHKLIPDPTTVSVQEGGTATFVVWLSVQPAPGNTLTVAVTSNNTDFVTVDPQVLTFDYYNYFRTVTVAGVDNDIADSDVGNATTIQLTVTETTEVGYTGVTASVPVTRVDNDSAGFVVTAPDGGLKTTEGGGEDTFSIRLTSEPTHDVTVGVSSSDPGEATVSPTSVVLTAGNWKTGVTVTVTGVNDAVVDGDTAYTIVLANSVSEDPNYDDVVLDDVAGTNLDNDVAPVPTDDEYDTDPADEDGNAFNDTGSLDSETVAAIDTLVALKITQGTSASLFSPSQVVSRWQMALFLTRQLTAHGVTLPTASDQGFTDLSGLSAETRNAISQLAALDVTTGTKTGTYSPDAGVTRAQMALFMIRVLDATGVDLPTTFSGEFNDISDLSPEAQLAIRQLAALGVVFGVGDGAFDPTAEIPRWQMGLVIVRALKAAGIATS